MTGETAERAATLGQSITAIRQTPIPASTKGFGAWKGENQATSARIAAERPGLHDGQWGFPLLLLRESALEHNLREMAEFCAAAGVRLAPHGKTPMAPQLAARQLDAGAWGITVASIDQLRVFREAGAERLLLANELVNPLGIRWLADELDADPSFTAYCYVDSVEGVALLDRVLTEHAAQRPLPVLIELGHPGGRTGARTVATALAVAERAAATTTLRIAGVAGYEGGLGHEATPASLAAVADFCSAMRELTATLHARGWLGTDAVLTAGGSAYFDVVTRVLTAGWSAEFTPTVVLRSGAYLTHDHGFYASITPSTRDGAAPVLRPALELWAPVLSRPEPGLAILGVGKRDVSYDEGLPVALSVRHLDGRIDADPPFQVTAVNDQHSYLAIPDDALLAPGDLVCLGISHPCTTFDKWRVIPLFDDADNAIDAIHTFF